ncbi:uncharacterized protein LOC132388987 [Hypanus sabinus]|uniref:uncharacterized protein LOC132388987 n=1 Tax=Hypanus sabinus TaxID=79690 RepID=UPI0028C392E2|nr:uncharacterized protein LOC132388987 [Hypanus sabinus]
MDKSEPSMKKQLVKPDTPSPSGDGLTTPYSELNIRKDEPPIAEDEDPPIASGPGWLPTTAQTAAQEQEPKLKIGNRPYCLFCLFCLVSSAIIVIVVGFSIHGMHSDLRHQFTEMETKYRSVNETKAEICDSLTSRREQTCFKDCATNTDRRYYVSTFDTSFPRAMQECSNRDSRLLEINSRDEVSFVFRLVDNRNRAYWVGKCAIGDDATGLLYNVSSGRSSCSACSSSGGSDYCLHDKHHFICEKSAPCCPDIPEKIQVLCQQPGEPI